MRVHPIARMEMGHRGRALVEREFSAANIQAQFVSLFREVIARHGVVSLSVDQTRGEPPPPIARMERP
jgi:hypothetical protein